MTNEKETILTENSKVEEIEATTLKYEEKLAKERKEKKEAEVAYLQEKQKRIDIEEENQSLKDKLEKNRLEYLRGKEVERKSEKASNDLLSKLFG